MGAIVVAFLISAGVYALVSLGFSLAFRVSQVFNLAHGALLVSSGYLNYWLIVECGLPTWLSIGAALLGISSVGFLIEAVAIPAARSVGLQRVELLLLSWLTLIVIQNVIALIFHNQSIYTATSVSAGWDILGGRITPVQVAVVAAAFGVGATLLYLARSSRIGLQVSAVGDDLRLATIFGLPVRRLVAINGCAAALLTAGSGILLSYQEQLDPTLALRFSVIAIVATLIGRPWGPGGAVVGAVIVAFLEALVVYLVDPALKNAAVYVGLFVVVLWTYRRRTLPLET